MLQGQKNKQTLEILRRLRQQGAPRAPEIGTISLDMVSPAPDEVVDEQEALEESQGTVQVGTPKKKRKPAPTGY